MKRAPFFVLAIFGCATSPPRETAHAPSATTVSVPEPKPEEPIADESPSDAGRRSAPIALASGVRIEDVREGNGKIAEPGRRITVHYVGTLVDGTRFDSSRERRIPFEVELGKGHLIKGFEEGLTGMRVGGTRVITIPPELGYGERALPNIPAGSTLIFEVELLAVD
jgi:FKBP-type peptidyl-prolyl cis-trans isomerase